MRRRAALTGNRSAGQRRREQRRMLEAIAAAAAANDGSLATSLHTLLALDDLDDLDDFESGDLDLTLVQPYLLCVQAVSATTAAAVASVVAPLVLPADGRSGLRALLLAGGVAALALRAPLTLTKQTLSRGEKLVFAALRAAPVIALGALVAESLLHTHGCAEPRAEPRAADVPRVVAEGACALLLMLVGAVRTVRPMLSRAAGDRLVKLAFGTVVAAGALPRALDVESAPLSRPLDALRASTRVLRAFCFASVFAAMLLSTAPRKLARSSTVGLVATAASASAWALLVPSPLLFLAPAQVVAAAYARVKADPPGGAPHGAPGSPRAKAGVITATLSDDGGSDVALLEEAPVKDDDPDVREAMRKLGVSKERRDQISKILNR